MKSELIASLSMEDVAEIISIFAPHISIFSRDSDGAGVLRSIDPVHLAFINGASIQIDTEIDEELTHWSYELAQMVKTTSTTGDEEI